MNYLLTGGTGFVGKHLVEKLAAAGHHAYIVTRFPEKHSNTTRATFLNFDQCKNLPPIHGVINLAGESLFGYWSKGKKQKILSSRLETTKNVIQLMKQMDPKPVVFISGSAVGYYGMSDEQIFTEETEKPGDDFLADVVVQWEDTAKQAVALGVRTVLARFGVILGKDGGALPLMTLPTKLFIGGRVGKGEQWMSWIHIEDAVDMMLFALNTPALSGAYNVTAPTPIRNKEFQHVLANVLHRPYWIPAPAPLVRTATGQMSQLLLKGQYVLPNKATENGYLFHYRTVESALADIF